MPTAAQLKFLIERAQRQSDTNVQQLAKTRTALSGAEAQLELLLRYRKDYQTQLGVTVSNGTDSERLRNFQRFIGNITQAIDQQGREIETRKAAAQRADLVWRESQRVLQSYQMLEKRAASHVRLREQIKEQKQNDEFATKNFIRLTRES
ncbi:MAG: flagellar export protein FliJ [Pseudomonadota bacterium]